MMSNKEVINEFYTTVSRTRMMAAERLSNELKTFAEGNGLTMSVSSDDWTFIHLKFADKANPERTYSYPLATRHVDNWDEEFMNITHEVSMKLLGEESRTDEDERPLYASSLTKQEHIALELTKAWASTRSHAYTSRDDMVDCYYKILEDVKERVE